MTEYKNTDFEARSRYVKRLQNRAEKKVRLQIFAVIGMIALAVVLISVIAINLFTKANSGSAAKTVEKPLESILLLGIEQKNFDQYSSGYSILVYDPNQEQINVLKFPPRAKVLIPGYGFDSINKSMFGGVDAAISTATNLTGVKIDRYISLQMPDYKTVVTKTGLKNVFLKIFNTNVSSNDQVKLTKAFKKIKIDNVNLLDVPVEELKVGNIYAAQPKKAELKRLVRVLWGDNIKTRTKVIVLNGMGKPGVGGKIAQQLIKEGFEILDITNARSFNYKKTLIVVYSLSKKKDSQKIKKLIKLGDIQPTVKNQEYTDITIIIGKDYH